METILNLASLQTAQLLKMKLGSEGIEAFIPDEVSAGLEPHVFLTRTGIRLQVKTEDVVAAKKIVEAQMESFREEEEED